MSYTWDGMHVEHGWGWSACTACGLARARNCDALAVDVSGECLAFVVADGVSSLGASPVASEAAVRTVTAWARHRRTLGPQEIPQLLDLVNEAVGQALRHQKDAGATTLACALLTGGRGVVATVGDSEVLAVETIGPARRLNELDHVPTRPNMLLAWIDGETALEPHVVELDSLPYRLCLVTDGIVKALDYERIAGLVRESPASQAARTLVLAAREAGSPDDVTALVVGTEVLGRAA